jgi:hypothetical protein
MNSSRTPPPFGGKLAALGVCRSAGKRSVAAASKTVVESVLAGIAELAMTGAVPIQPD